MGKKGHGHDNQVKDLGDHQDGEGDSHLEGGQEGRCSKTEKKFHNLDATGGSSKLRMFSSYQLLSCHVVCIVHMKSSDENYHEFITENVTTTIPATASQRECQDQGRCCPQRLHPFQEAGAPESIISTFSWDCHDFMEICPFLR